MIRNYCVSCLVDLKDMSEERYEQFGNYCGVCSSFVSKSIDNQKKSKDIFDEYIIKSREKYIENSLKFKNDKQI